MEQELNGPKPPSQSFSKMETRTYTVRDEHGMQKALDYNRLYETIVWAAGPHVADINLAGIIEETIKNIFDGVTSTELADALVLAASAFMEIDPAYGYTSGRLLFKRLFKRITGFSARSENYDVRYRMSFLEGIKYGVSRAIFDQRMLDFDLDFLSQHIDPTHDHLFGYMGMRTLYERYFARHDGQYFELPQSFWMRVAMGLSYNEVDKNNCALQFYRLMSTLQYVPSTPTLLHSGRKRPQLSSCYLTTVEDDLVHIFKCFGDNAQLSKWSGGVANDWTNVRAIGSMVRSIDTESQGVIPFLRIVSDTTAAINRSGKRRSATVVYLEVWHFEIEDFLDLRRNTGDERRRTHDINTAAWIPDLFMKRVLEDANWTLFSPDEVPDLHHIYGRAFEQRYEMYEEKARHGKINLHKSIPARQLWRKMLSRLFETGHPWITFKDAANIRSPQDHAGVVHSSNLCTEITLNTSAEETAVCNLGSINLTHHILDGSLNRESLAEAVITAVRMLDNVIDINFYPTKEAQNANMRHRPIGLGLMGLQDALYLLDIHFDAPEALIFANSVMEFISYHAILASSKLAKERGTYSSYHGSKWHRGIFPQDTLTLLEKERGIPITTPKIGYLDWRPVYDHVAHYGMRNSNTMAIAPTATISNISGCFPCIEPAYKNLYVKANMSGEFTIINRYLVADLKKLNLWNQEMIELVKYYDGSIQMIDTIPQKIKNKYKEAFDLDPLWLVKMTAHMAQWVDQSISHNVFLKGISGKLLNDIYMAGWKAGMKTYYYLRSLGATQIEKSTLDANKFGFTQKRTYENIDMAQSEGTSHLLEDILVVPIAASSVTNVQAARSCSLIDSECEACQ
jgi:ribonucleoside-diphosphate reductase alpha chain